MSNKKVCKYKYNRFMSLIQENNYTEIKEYTINTPERFLNLFCKYNNINITTKDNREQIKEKIIISLKQGIEINNKYKNIFNQFIKQVQKGYYSDIKEFIEATGKDELIEFCEHNGIINVISGCIIVITPEYTKEQIKNLIIIDVYTEATRNIPSEDIKRLKKIEINKNKELKITMNKEPTKIQQQTLF